MDFQTDFLLQNSLHSMVSSKLGLLGFGDVTGNVDILQYPDENGNCPAKASFKPHTRAVRSISFIDGRILTSSSDLMVKISDLEYLETIGCNKTKYPVNSLTWRDSNSYVTGDDEGNICHFDVRTKKVVAEFHDAADYITFILISPKSPNTIFAGSGDGTIFGYDLVKGKLTSQSGTLEDDEILSGMMTSGGDVVFGTQERSLGLIKQGDYDEISTLFAVAKDDMSVNCIEWLGDQDKRSPVLAGCSDGFVRCCGLSDHTSSIIAEHEEPVEMMMKAGTQILTGSFGKCIKVWQTDPKKILRPAKRRKTDAKTETKSLFFNELE